MPSRRVEDLYTAPPDDELATSLAACPPLPARLFVKGFGNPPAAADATGLRDGADLGEGGGSGCGKSKKSSKDCVGFVPDIASEGPLLQQSPPLLDGAGSCKNG